MKQEDANIAVDEIQTGLGKYPLFRHAFDECSQDDIQNITQMMYNHIMHAIEQSAQGKEG